MLLHQQGGRHQHRDLLAVLDRLEGGPHRDLGLAVTDVAADEAVHGDGALHVGLDLVDGAELVGGLDVGEGVLELALPRGVGRERVTRRGHPRRVELDQLGRDLLDVLARPALGLLPVAAAHAVERRLLATDVAGHLVELVGRHEQPVTGLPALGGCVLEDEVLAGGTADRALHHLDELAHAVLFMDDEVAGLELEGVDLVAPPRRHLAHVLGRATLARGAREVGLGDEGETACRRDESAADATRGQVDDAVGQIREVGVEPGGDGLTRTAPRPRDGPDRHPR